MSRPADTGPGNVRVTTPASSGRRWAELRVIFTILIGFFGRRQISLDFFTDYGARKIVHFFTAINSEKVSIIVRT